MTFFNRALPRGPRAVQPHRLQLREPFDTVFLSYLTSSEILLSRMPLVQDANAPEPSFGFPMSVGGHSAEGANLALGYKDLRPREAGRILYNLRVIFSGCDTLYLVYVD